MTNLEKLFNLEHDLTKPGNKIYFAEMLDEIKTALVEIHRIRVEMHEVIKVAREENDPELKTIKEVKGRMEEEINETTNTAKRKAECIYSPEFYTKADFYEIINMEV